MNINEYIRVQRHLDRAATLSADVGNSLGRQLDNTQAMDRLVTSPQYDGPLESTHSSLALINLGIGRFLEGQQRRDQNARDAKDNCRMATVITRVQYPDITRLHYTSAEFAQDIAALGQRAVVTQIEIQQALEMPLNDNPLLLNIKYNIASIHLRAGLEKDAAIGQANTIQDILSWLRPDDL